jgi:glycosyltransferase involved in cell wall biosynthesis
MRVVIIGPHPLSTISNGVEAVVVYLLEGMRALDGLELFVISGRHDIDKELVQKFDGYTVLFLPAPRRFGNITMGLMEKRRTRELLRELRPDVVHVHNHPNYPYLFSRPSFPTVTTIHGLIFQEVKYGSGFMDDLRKWPRVLHERLALNKIEEPAAVTPYVRDMIRPWTKARIHILENPVSEKFFHAEDLPTSKSILSVGLIIRRKNFLDLFKAVHLLRPRLPELELRIVGGVGDDSYLMELRRFVEEHELQNSIRFLGSLNEEQLVREYTSCGVVALASSEESAGMVFQQAMAARKAVVATRVGGVPDIVDHGRTGLLVESGKVGELADALSTVLQDEDLRIRLGQAGRQEALKRFHPKMVAVRTYSLYQQLINQAMCPCE